MLPQKKLEVALGEAAVRSLGMAAHEQWQTKGRCLYLL